MHQAQRIAGGYLAGCSAPAITARALNAGEARTLAKSLGQDARDCYYSGVLSVADSVQSLDRGFYSWATVKLYYAAFYLARSALALSGYSIIYAGTTPYAWRALPGEVPVKRSGPTHKVVLNAFPSYLAGHVLVSQNIGVDLPFDWLMARREEVNYKFPKFCEPSAPNHFSFVASRGIRRAVGAYLDDKSYMYAFDPDHAMLAFPLAGLKLLHGSFASGQPNELSKDDASYLTGIFLDRSGPLADIQNLFDEVI